MQWSHRFREESAVHSMFGAEEGEGEFLERADRKELSFGQSCNETMNNPLENTDE